MTKIGTHNKSLLFLLIFTIVSSYLAYKILMKAYDVVLSSPALELAP